MPRKGKMQVIKVDIHVLGMEETEGEIFIYFFL